MSTIKGRRIRLLRESYGLTQEVLAAKVSLSLSTIAMLESGKRNGKTTTIKKLADFFNTEIDFIEGRETQMDLFKEYLLTIPLDKNNKIPPKDIPALVENVEEYLNHFKKL